MQLAILVTGHNATGKTTLANKLSKDLGISTINSDDFREFVKSHIGYYSDLDYSVVNKKASSLTSVIAHYRDELSRVLLDQGQSVLYQANLIRAEDRKSVLNSLAKAHSPFKSVILHCELQEEKLLERLRERQVSQPGSRWLDHYTLDKKLKYQRPASDEADIVLYYDQSNYETILSTLVKLRNN